jgi:crotonobetainyl-CoA:carnitine CoA-transferase CaiB-like acyl-CoA transferase
LSQEEKQGGGPLVGIRVVDLTSVILGPLATMILGDMGADVIKVEAPEGDILRWVAPFRNQGMGAVFLNANRNKRSVVLDLKQVEARAALAKLVQTADVFVHSMRPQAIARLGFGPEALLAQNPRLIYCGAYGFSERGPYAGKPAYDDIIQAACGIAALQRDEGGAPRYVRSILADKTTGLTVAYAVAMALFERERSGKGQAIEIPMFETMVAFTMTEHLAGLTFDPPLGPAGYDRMMAPHRKPYPTRDGYIALLPYTNAQWARFFDLAGRPEMKEDRRVTDPGERSRDIAAMYALVAELTPARTTADWLAALDRAEIPAMPVNEPDDLIEDAHLLELAFIRRIEHPSEGRLVQMGIPVGFTRTPGSVRRPAPRLGEHTEEVLREIGAAS